jgi:hypothetical protein
MALGVTVDKSTLTLLGAQLDIINIYGTLQFDNSYPTSGEALVVATVNSALTTAGYSGSVTSIERMYVAAGLDSGTLYHCVWDATNGKVLVYVGTTGAQVANAVDLSGLDAVEFHMVCKQ